MALKKTALAAALATTFFAAAGLTAQAADPSANTSMSPTGSGVNSDMGTAPSHSMPDRAASTDPMPSNPATSDSMAGKRMHHGSTAHRGMTGSSSMDRSSGYSTGATGTDASEGMSSSMHNRHSMHSGHMKRQAEYSGRRSGRGDPEGDRAVTALNTLMAAGYESYSDFRAEGRNFSAYATRDGKGSRVIIDPESRSVMPNG